MLNILLIIVITYVQINAYNQVPNNIYKIYKNINIGSKNADNIIKNSDYLPPYKIPKWVYKKVFNYNKINKELKEKDYYYQLK